MKVCFKCGVVKPLDEFYRHPMMGDGHLGKCKPCTRTDVRTSRAAKLEAYRAYDRARYLVEGDRRRTPAPTTASDAKKAWDARNRHKRRAQGRVAHAMRAGALVRPERCQRCEVRGVALHAHHHDYSKPLDVEWLCPACHGFQHRRYPIDHEAVQAVRERRDRRVWKNF